MWGVVCGAAVVISTVLAGPVITPDDIDLEPCLTCANLGWEVNSPTAAYAHGFVCFYMTL
jgi:hypothetical protein